jgi:hypothetical protein
MASNKRSRPPVPKNRYHYFGGNATRASVCQNPGAYVGRSDPLFGAAEFRSVGFASEATRDAAADRQMAAGYTKKRNPVCDTCFVQKPNTGICTTCAKKVQVGFPGNWARRNTRRGRSWT